MDDASGEELPSEAVVPLEEARQVVTALERHLESLREGGDRVGAELVDAVLGRITRWVWPYLRDLDHEEDGYDG